MYERTYHKTVLKTETKAVKKTGRINWRLVLWIMVTAIVIAGMIFLIRLPQVQVRTIEVTGVNVVDPGDVKEFIHNDLQGRRLFILPKSSIFLVRTHSLEKALKAQFSRFQTVSVSRKNFSTLSVAVTEYQGIYLWCADTATCYAMDQNGVAFAPAPYFSGSAYPKVFIGSMRSIPFQALTAAQVSLIGTLLDKLPALSITPSEFHFVTDHELDVSFNHGGHHAMLLFDPTAHVDQSMNALFTGLRTNPLASKFHDSAQVLQYIDLRFSNRIVYKFQ
jgi:hypothetical protein